MRIIVQIARRIPAVLILLTIWILSSMPNPHMPDLGFDFTDKVFHFIAFAAFSAAACLWISNERWRKRPLQAALAIIFIAILAGALDEFHQTMVPNRVASLSDLAADTAGALFGTLVMGILLAKNCMFPAKK
jgi:VanZ family protein